MRRKAVLIVLQIIIACFLISCRTNTSAYTIIEAPESVRKNIVSYAFRYAQRDTVFLTGGRPFLEKKGTLRIDCSGLIVRVCQYALIGTGYSLLFDDATVFTLYTNYTSLVDKAAPGDFIFMGERNPPTHIGIFIKEEDGLIYFIDATQKEADEYYPAVDGVTMRHYPKDDPRFLSFARVLVARRARRSLINYLFAN